MMLLWNHVESGMTKATKRHHFSSDIVVSHRLQSDLGAMIEWMGHFSHHPSKHFPTAK